MFKRLLSGRITGRAAVLCAVAIITITITAAASGSTQYEFLDQVKQLFGLESTQSTVLKAAPQLAAKQNSEPMQPMFFALPLTAGNLMVLQSDAQTSAATTVSLLEFQKTGTGQSPLNTIAINSTVAAAPGNAALTQSGSATSEGFLSRTQDGRYLLLVGYNAANATAGVATGSADRVIGRVDASGSVDTTTRAPGLGTKNIRGVASSDGSTIYVTSNATSTGISSLSFGTQPGSTNVINATNSTPIGVFGNQLYAAGTIGALGSVGSGLPTTTATYSALSAAVGSTSSSQFFFLDRDGAVSGVDQVFIADGASGIKKYSFDGSTWTARGTITGTFFGVVIATNGTGTDIYATTGTGTSAANALVKYTDTAAYNATGSFGTATTLATAAAGKAFRGVAFAPVTAATPTITGAATATAFTTTYGTASAAQTFSVSGSNLTVDLVATAPTGFEVSPDGTTYGTTATFTQSGGTAGGSLRIRLKANAAVAGTYNAQNIVLSSTGATPVNITTAASGNTVSRASLTVTASSTSLPYGSAVPTITPAYGAFQNGETSSVVTAAPSCTTAYTTTSPAGTTPSTSCSGGTIANYTFNFVNGTVTVTLANQTTPSVTAPSSVTYGSTGTLTATGGESTGGYTFSVGSSTGCNISGGTTVNVTNASGTCAATVTKAGDSNYNVSASSASFPITLNKASQATLTVDNPGTVTYGSTPTLSASGGSTAGAITFSDGGSAGCTITSGGVLTVTNASAACAITATRAGDNNYSSVSSAAFNVTLAKAAQTASITNSPQPYTGSTQTATVACSAGTASLASGGTGTNAGSYPATVDCTSTNNYAAATGITPTPSDFVINPVTPNVTVNVGGPYTYNGSAQGPTTFTTSPSGDTGTATWSYVGVSPTVYAASATPPSAAGSYTATVSVGSDSNFNAASSSATAFSIGAAASSITVTGSNSFVFDTTPQGPSTYTNSGSGGAVTFSYVGTGGTSYAASATKPTNVGTYTATATVAADANYEGATSTAFAFSITPAGSTVTVTGGTTFTYNTAPQGPNTSTHTGSSGAITFSYEGTGGTTYTASATRPTSVGTYTATATLAADANYDGAVSNPYAFSITPAASTISVTGSNTFAYNGAAQGPTTTSVTGSTGAVTFSYEGTGGTTYTASSTRPTAVGTYQATATVAADANYAAQTSAPFAFDITVGTSTISVTGSATFTYSGAAQGPTGSSVTGSTGAVTFSYVGVSGTTYAASATRPTNAGDYEATASVAADGNYSAATSAAFGFTINKATPVITFGTAPTPTYPGANFNVSATTTNTDSSAIIFGTGSVVCTFVSGTTFTPTAVGTCIVTANSIETANFNAAAQATQNVDIVAVGTHTITASAGAGGSISPSGAVIVNDGDNQTFTISADAGYHIADVLVDSVSNSGAIGSGTYTFTANNDNHTISASFALNSTTIGSTGDLAAGTYGNVTIQSPAVVTLTGDVTILGTITVENGATLNMGGYVITGGSFVLADGGTLGIGSTGGIAASGATGNVQTASRTFSQLATFVYNGSTNQAAGDGLPVTVLNLTIANTGTAPNDVVTGNGGQAVTGTLSVLDGNYSSHSDYTDVVIAAAGTLTLTNNTTVSGNWTNNGGTLAGNFTVTLDGTDQTITGNTTFYGLSKTVTAARTLTFATGSTTTVTNALTLTGTSGNALTLTTPSGTWALNATGTRTIDYVTVDHSDATGSGTAVNATHSSNGGNNTNWTFNTISNYTLTASAGANGTIDPSGATIVSTGANQTYRFFPASGYDIDTVTVDSVALSGAALTAARSTASYTFSSIGADHTISVSFAASTCRTISTAVTTSVTGASITVPVSTTDTTGANITSAQFKLTYDPAVLQPSSATNSVFVTAGTVLPGGTTVDVNRGTSGSFATVEISSYGTVPFSGAGSLVDFHFNVIGAPGTTSALTISETTPAFTPVYYNGGAVCANATSGSHAVIQTSTTTTLTASPASPQVYGTNATFTATVSPNPGGGSVQFKIDGVNYGSAVTVDGSGQASFSISSLPVTGSPHVIEAYYLGFAPYAASNGSTNFTVTPRTLTVSATGQNKVYDATTNATVSLSDDRISGDILTTAYTTAAFLNKNVGNGKTVNVSGISISGASAANYSLAGTTATTTADITARDITVSATGINKVYDGNTTATVTLSDNRVSGDVLSTAYTSASFNNKNVGNGKPVSVTGISISGTDAANYNLTNATATTTADITGRNITVTATGISKVYDGNADATVTLSDNRISGDVLTTAYTAASFNNKNVGTGKPVSVTGISIGGTDAANYNLTNTTTSTTADITARDITISATGINKVYDGNTSATVTMSDNRVSGDVLITAYTTAAFLNKSVGNAKTVNVSGISIGGTDAGNYNLTNTTASTTADITVRDITVSATGVNKVYDGNTTATVTLSDNRVSGDVLTTAYTAASFNNKNVGTGKAVNVTGISISGADAANYSLLNITATTTADITARDLTISATGVNKVYDGNATATVSLSDNRISGDVFSSSYTASFNNKNVGTGKAVSVTGISISGTDAANYNLTNTTASTTADITARDITVSATGINKVYDGNTAATVTLSDNRVSGDVLATAYTTASFLNKNVGTGKPVSVTGISIGGTDAANYNLTNTTASTTADITARDITISAIGINKVYDGNANATVTLSDNRVSGDVLTTAYTAASFLNKNVGTGKAVSVTGISISGTDSGNYNLLNTTASTSADITARDLTVSATGINKVYDGNATATVTLSDNRVSGDLLTTAYTAASFDNKNVGTGKPVSVTGISISGTDAGNYNLTNTTASTTADITARDITVSATGINKVYDGNADATVTLSDNRVSGDVLSTAYTAASFDNKNVGTGKPVSVTGISISGTDAANYNLTNTTASTTADITRKAATWTTVDASKSFGAADPVPLTTGTGTGFLVADGVTATYSRDAGETVGTYHITATLSATGDLNNYSITNTGATFTIYARTVTGTVTYKNAASGPGLIAVPNTTITAAGPSPLPSALLNQLDGTYSMTGFGAGLYTLSASKPRQACSTHQGIFSNDASRISQAVVHIGPPLTASQKEAAMVSDPLATTVTSFDASLLAQYIVCINNPVNLSGKWTFNQPSAAEITPTSVQDFEGILKGDVNGSWTAAGPRPAEADAQTSVRAMVPNTSAAPGVAVNVPLRIENLNGQNVESYQFDITYDPNVIQPMQNAATVVGTRSEGLAVVSNAPVAGLLKVVVYGALPVSGDGVYVNLGFSTIGANGSTSPVNIEGFRFNNGDSPVFAVNGSVTVSTSNDNSIHGRLLTAMGQPIKGASVVLASTTGQRVGVLSSSFGYFDFSGLTIGETYTVYVQSNRYTFTPRTVSMTGGVAELEMIAEQ